MPCFDKKLEAIRFNLDEQTKEVDITLATNEVQNLINEFPANYFKEISLVEQGMEIEQNGIFLNENLSNSLRFLEDQTSNGYISFLLKRMSAKNVK